jgi:hypothetical protein
MNVEIGNVAIPSLGIFVSNFRYWFFALQLFRLAFSITGLAYRHPANESSCISTNKYICWYKRLGRYMGKHIMFNDCIPLQNISDIRCFSRRGCLPEKGGKYTPPPHLHCVRELMYMPIFATLHTLLLSSATILVPIFMPLWVMHCSLVMY